MFFRQEVLKGVCMKFICKGQKGKLSTGNPQIYPHFLEKIMCLWYNFHTGVRKTNLKDCRRGDDMWYSAKEIAKYIITKCFNLDQPVSNLKLQKMLYYLWVDFYKKTGRMLFCDNICAWQLGPVVPDVYYEYCSHAGRPILGNYATGIKPEDEKILDSIISDYINVSANELVSRTHTRGSAWDSVYRDGAGNRNIIPFDLIIKREVG